MKKMSLMLVLSLSLCECACDVLFFFAKYVYAMHVILCLLMEFCRMLLLGLSILSPRPLNNKKLQGMALGSLMHP